MSKVLEANGLNEDQIRYSDAAILEVIRYYTRESGVRNLERELASIARKVARAVVRQGESYKCTKVSPKLVRKHLGVHRFRFGKTESEDRIGVTTGLAYTEVGGELLQTEVAVSAGQGKLQITGRLGEVMQESAGAAMSAFFELASLSAQPARSTASRARTLIIRISPSCETPPVYFPSCPPPSC